MSKTKIMFCGCVHKFQDDTYGKQMRVHNEGNTKGTVLTYRCTVCGTKKGKTEHE